MIKMISRKIHPGDIVDNDRGVAILMVVGSIALLTYLLAEFTFETKLNKIKVQNGQDRVQARLNAESGLTLAMAKLRLYQKARNMIEGKKSLKERVDPDMLQSVVTMPFIYPITLPPRSDIIQRNAVAEFEKSSLVQGEISLSVAPVSRFLNPNNLRIPIASKESDDEDGFSATDDDLESEGSAPHEYLVGVFIQTLQKRIIEKKESQELGPDYLSDIDETQLVDSLKYFVNSKGKFNSPLTPDSERQFDELGITPKHAPLSSITEMHLLPGWSDEIVDLIKDQISVHDVTIIPLNKITDKQLANIFPSITPEQSKEFFEWRDGTEEEEPHPFKSPQDFKELIVSRLAVLDEDDYSKRIKEFASAGLQLGIAGKLFKVVSRGTFKRASYTITAYINLPIKPLTPVPKKTEEQGDKNDDSKKTDNPDDDDEQDDQVTPKPDENDESKKEPPPMELLAPRVVEINIT
jgi:type II secretory pathway component PulK